MKPLDQAWSIPIAVELACVLEASAPKLGNVHPAASFDDMHFGHFLASAVAVGPVFENAGSWSVGKLVLAAVTATRDRVGCNTNLGTLLLLSPLAVAAAQVTASGIPLNNIALAEAVQRVLRGLTPKDSQDVYAAIRMAQPGGLGQVDHNDVQSAAPLCLVTAMRQAAGVDAVARQYATDFADIFQRLLPWLQFELQNNNDPLQAIVRLQLRWLAWEPDGLIVRKLGLEESRQIQQQAIRIESLLETDPELAAVELKRFDQFLRTPRNRRNPGTTADLIATALFCHLLCFGH